MKDTNNLLDYNQWVADYDETPDGFYHGAGLNVYCSNKISTIGESSFKFIKVSSSSAWAEVRKTSNDTQFTGTADIYNPNADGFIMMVITYTDNTQSTSRTNVSISNSLQKDISCSIDATSGKTVSNVALRFVLDGGYADNLRLN